jgi:hypothetical protein
MQRLADYVSAGGGWEIGENIAWGEGSYATPAAIVGSWMQSVYHRANILSASFAEIGIGIAPGGPVGSSPPNAATYTTNFGSRAAPPVGAAPAPRPTAPPAVAPSAQSASDPGTARAKPPARKPAKKVSAARKRRITAQCKRSARRTRSSHAGFKRRVERCVRARVRAAVRRG